MSCLGVLFIDSCAGSQSFKRMVQDLAFVEEVRAQAEAARRHYEGWQKKHDGVPRWTNRDWWRSKWPSIWEWTCDYGWGWTRIAKRFMQATLLFAFIYCWDGVLAWEDPFPEEFGQAEGSRVIGALYFSVVTLTTLGFGDVRAGSIFGACVVAVEVILGYLILGLLVSILANLVARRS